MLFSPHAPSRGRRRAVALLTLTLAWGSAAYGQVLLDLRDRIDFDRPEAWGLKYAAAVAGFTALGSLDDLRPGGVEVALEGAPVPSLSREDRRLGFVGTKVEDIDRPAAFGRLRVRLGLPRGWVVGLGVVPPVRLEGLEPRLSGIDLAHTLVATDRFRLAARAVLQRGEIRGDITCSAADVAAGDDPIANPFGCEARSRDTASIDTTGLELTLAARRRGRIEPYVGLAAHYLNASFQVDARYSGLVDRTRLDTDGWLGWATFGAERRWPSGWRAAGELQYTPLRIRRPGEAVATRSVVDLRLLIALRLR